MLKKMDGQGLALLFTRVTIGMMMIFPHGWGKMIKFEMMSKMFPDPIGLGSTFSLCLVIFAEVICQIFIILGIKVRWFSVPPLITMLVAALAVHGNDPWASKEKPLLFAIFYFALIISRGGKYSVRD